MTTTPLTTIAEALIEFILSLLRDPAASQEFLEDPEGSMARAGLADICGEDVRAVAPVIVDRPDVVARPASQTIVIQTPTQPTSPQVTPIEPPEPEVIREITTIATTFQIDSRSTVIDQSVNQNIWAEGDVTQLFDQEAVLAVGDDSVAAGDDAMKDESDTDVTVGDVNIGNEDTDVSIDGSFNDESTDVDLVADTDVDDSLNDQSTDVDVDTEIEDSFNDQSTDVDVEAEDSFNDESTEVDTEVEGSFNDTQTNQVTNTETTAINAETVEVEVEAAAVAAAPVEIEEPMEQAESYEPLVEDEEPLEPEFEDV